MTQIELRSCPFCNGDAMRNAPATRYVHGVHCTKCVCELTAFDTQELADAAWNTRSDTREQAAASPSAVGEADYKAWYAEAMIASNECGFVGLTAAETIRELHKDLLSSHAPSPVAEWQAHGTKPCGRCDGEGTVANRIPPSKYTDDPYYAHEVPCHECDGAGFEPADASDAMTLDDVEALSAQAPKPASAACYDLLVEARGWITKPASGHDEGMMYVNFIERLDAAIAAKPASAGGAEACLAAAMVEGIYEAIANGDIERIRDIWNRRLGAIAAEDDTAKEQRKYRCTICRSAIVYHDGEICDSCGPSAADRLAPIEARGAVTVDMASLFAPERMPARDEDGHACHPDLSLRCLYDFDPDDEAPLSKECLASLGWEYRITSFDHDDAEDDDDPCETYYRAGIAWQPEPPGPEWRLVCTSQDEDGDWNAWWVRRIAETLRARESAPAVEPPSTGA